MTTLSDGDKLRALKQRVSNDDIKAVLEALVDVHGARLVTENLVEVFHDKADRIRDKAMVWSRIATKMGNTVHWTNLEWPS